MDETQNLPYVSLHLTSKGRYYWDIKFNLVLGMGMKSMGDALKDMDKVLRQRFPNNVAEIQGGRSSFKGVNELDED